MNTSLGLVVAGCALLLCGLDGAAQGASERESVAAAPEPSRPWMPPTTGLPAVVVSAVTDLFDNGLPDPRGCEYREIKIGDLGSRTIDTHGWVLPGASGASRDAIGWNGVIFHGVEVGAPADLHADFARMAAESDRRFRGERGDWGYWDSLAVDSELPIKVAFLLRLGEGTLAEGMWNAGYADDEKAKAADPFAGMARFWLGRWYNQASAAYLRGDYASALEAHEALTRADRIARLIRDLENVSVHQMMNPGETEVFDDPIVQALCKEGDDAVKPLLGCLRENDRLTLSRWTHHLDFGGPIIPVYEAAYTALFRLLDVSFPLFDGDRGELYHQKSVRDLTREERLALAAKLEAVWRKGRGLALKDKAFRTLQDDKAGAQAWFRAVDDIVQPDDGSFTSYRVAMPPVGSYTVRSTEKPFTPRGEALRSRTEPDGDGVDAPALRASRAAAL